VTESVFAAFYFDPRYKPAFTQKRLSEAGWLGRKSGRGYYRYSEDGSADSEHQATAKLEAKSEIGQKIVNRIVALLIDEAADAVMFGIASRDDVDTAMTKGVNYPKGLLAWADEIGISEVVKRLDDLYAHYHDPRYRCSGLLRTMADKGQTFY
jgi:3-hydroxybutyryl-CoA dehydrogenase